MDYNDYIYMMKNMEYKPKKKKRYNPENEIDKVIEGLGITGDVAKSLFNIISSPGLYSNVNNIIG